MNHQGKKILYYIIINTMGFNRRVIIGVLLVILFVLTMMTNREQMRKPYLPPSWRNAIDLKTNVWTANPHKNVCGQLRTQCRSLIKPKGWVDKKRKQWKCHVDYDNCKKLLVRKDSAMKCKYCDWKSKCPACPKCPECPKCGEETEKVEEVVAVTPEEVKETDEVIAEVASKNDIVETYTLSPMPINIEGYRMY
jgi:hypothetical protein